MGTVLVLLAMASAAVGVVVDVRESRRTKGPVGGPGGTFRSVSWAGFVRGLPFYLLALFLLLAAQ